MCKSVSSSSVHGTDMSLHRRLDEQTVLVTAVIVVVNIAKYEEALRILKQHSPDGKFPTMKDLRTEKEQLTIQKDAQYDTYHYFRDYHKELQTVCANVDNILGTEREVQREQQQSRKNEHSLYRLQQQSIRRLAFVPPYSVFCSISFRCGGLSIERNQKPLAPEITLAVTHHDRQKQVEVKRSSRVNPHEIRLFSGCPYAVVK